MKYSSHRVNIRTIRNMEVGEKMLLKHGKRVQYESGYTYVPESSMRLPAVHDWLAIDMVKYCAKSIEPTNKRACYYVEKVDDKRYIASIAFHYSRKEWTANSPEYKLVKF